MNEYVQFFIRKISQFYETLTKVDSLFYNHPPVTPIETTESTPIDRYIYLQYDRQNKINIIRKDIVFEKT